MRQQTRTWLEMASSDLDFAKTIIAHGQRPFYAAHFCHQAVEKLLKAIVQERTGDTPPRTHNFPTLCKAAGLVLPEDKNDLLLSLAPHFLATRYPEDISRLHQQYTAEYVAGLVRRTEELFSWLQAQLISTT